MNELIVYFLPHKALSLVILISIVIIWLKKFKGKTCITPLSGAFIVLFGAIIIWFYPIGVFACDVCELTFLVPYFVLPFIIFFVGLGITKAIKIFKTKV